MMIVKNTTNTSAFFVAMPVHKIFITCFFKGRIEAFIKFVAGVFIGLVKMPGIFFKQVIRR